MTTGGRRRAFPDSRARLIDTAYSDLAARVPPRLAWLLLQTLGTGAERRALLASLPLQPGFRVLDLGCGFGTSTAELASLGAAGVGLDADASVLQLARAAAAALPEAGDLAFAAGSAYEIPFPDASFDGAFCRFVFQHLRDPGRAAAEMARVLRPGATACVVDADDGLSLSEPPASPAYERLAEALRASQQAGGGDRYVGRKLAAILDAAGMEPVSVVVLAQAGYRRPSPGEPERALLVQRLRAARQAIVAGGHMAADAFDADLASLAAEDPGATCEVEAHLAVVATRRT